MLFCALLSMHMQRPHMQRPQEWGGGVGASSASFRLPAVAASLILYEVSLVDLNLTEQCWDAVRTAGSKESLLPWCHRRCPVMVNPKQLVGICVCRARSVRDVRM
jgi:hypothetical protein